MTSHRAIRYGAGILAAVLYLTMGGAIHADEFSMLSDSSVIGRNFGYPSGDPSRPEAETGELELGIETAFFFKNLELTGFSERRIDGETFFGFLAPLRLRFRAHEKVHLEAGAFLGQNFGDDDALDATDPLLRLVVEPSDDFFIVAGSLLPTHWMHDALRDDTLIFREGSEMGVQFRADWLHLKQDTWINWNTRETDTDPEQFDVGNTTQVRFGGLRGDGQLLWSHVGGQKNSSNRIENNLSLATGASYGFSIGPFVEDVRLGGFYLYSSDDARGQPSQSGSGVEGRLHVDLRPAPEILVRVFASYFDGDELQADRGDPLYGLDDYAQVGVAALFDVAADLRIETAIVGQYGENELINTYLVNFVWGGNFPILNVPGFGPEEAAVP